MSVHWKLTDEEAEELSCYLLELYKAENRKRGGKKNAEKALKYYASLEMRVREQKRSAEPGRLRPCAVTFLLDDEQYRRVCALQDAMSAKEPEYALETALTFGSKALIDKRLSAMERAYWDGAEGKEESG